MKLHMSLGGGDESFACPTHGLDYPIYLYQAEPLRESTYVAAYCYRCVIELIGRELQPLATSGKKQ